MKHWEKTVEILCTVQLVLIAMRAKKDCFVSHFDGNAETQAADAVFGADDKCLLIEYKRDKGSLGSERRKGEPDQKQKIAQGLFKGEDPREFKLTSGGIENHPSKHHLLIYGDASGPKFQLLAVTYFGRQQVEFRDILSYGLPAGEFASYLGKLAQRRTGSSNPLGDFEAFQHHFGDSAVVWISDNLIEVHSAASGLSHAIVYEKRIEKGPHWKVGGNRPVNPDETTFGTPPDEPDGNVATLPPPPPPQPDPNATPANAQSPAPPNELPPDMDIDYLPSVEEVMKQLREDEKKRREREDDTPPPG